MCTWCVIVVAEEASKPDHGFKPSGFGQGRPGRHPFGDLPRTIRIIY